MIFLELSFPSHSVDYVFFLHFIFFFLFFPFFKEEAINELLNMEKDGLSNWGKMFFILQPHLAAVQ